MQTFDPDAPLAGSPDPWNGSEMPSPRSQPPYHMTEMILAEPAFARRVLDRLADPDGPAARLATAIRGAATAGRPVIVTGCGTSEHGAIAVAELLREANRAAGLPAGPGAGGSPVAVQALEGSLEPVLGGPGAVVIGVSHEGGTWATNRALAAARDSGATIGLITAAAGSPGAELGGIVVSTEELDQSWCHTVGYLSPILAGLAIGAHLAGRSVEAAAVADLLAAGLAPAAVAATTAMAGELADVDRLITLGGGADRSAARELTLKVEEGAHLPAAMRDLETFLHGHLAGTDERTGLVLFLADPSLRGLRLARALDVLRASREIGLRAGLIAPDVIAAEVDPTLTPAGRVAVPEAPWLAAPAAALLATAIPLQLLTERLAIARGRNPDPIRRDDPRYLAAAEVAG
jgi:glucosamine--fructose-6-phosphate aminotransferase (isomerizing)